MSYTPARTRPSEPRWATPAARVRGRPARGHVVRRPDAEARSQRAYEAHRHAEVDEEWAPRLVLDEDVLRLDFAMHDPDGMNSVQRACDLPDDGERAAQRKVLAMSTVAVEDLGEVLAAHELHRDEGQAVVTAEGED